MEGLYCYAVNTSGNDKSAFSWRMFPVSSQRCLELQNQDVALRIYRRDATGQRNVPRTTSLVPK